MKTIRLAVVAVLIGSLPIVAADPPKTGKLPEVASFKPFAQVDGKLGALSGDSITIKVPEVEQKNTSKTGVHITLTPIEKDYEYDLASDVRFRTQQLPKGSDGKAKQFTPEEYAKLREPAGAPGYKSDREEFHSGQIIRVYLGRQGPRDKPVVMNVLLIKDAPKMEEKPAEKPKKKGKS